MTKSILSSAFVAEEFCFSMTARRTLATARGSGDGEDSGVSMWIAESTPMARAVRRVSTDLGGPIVMAFIEVTEALRRSRRRTASSTARSKGRYSTCSKKVKVQTNLIKRVLIQQKYFKK